MSETPITDKLSTFLVTQFPATHGNLELHQHLCELERCERELNEAKTLHECFNCPECHCEEYTHANYLGKGFRVCASCKQEWWTDINYGKIDLHTKPLKADRDQWKAMAQELANEIEGSTDYATRTRATASVLSRFNALNKP